MLDSRNLQYFIKPQIEESVDEGVGDRVGASEDEEAVLQSRVQLFEGFLVNQKPAMIHRQRLSLMSEVCCG